MFNSLKGKVVNLHPLASLVLLFSVLVLMASCGGGGSGELTTPLPGGSDSTSGGSNTGGGDPTIVLPGGGSGSGNQGHPFPFTPSITTPPVESYRDASSTGDSTQTKWLKNCLEPIPAIGSSSHVYQNASLQTWADLIFQGVNAERSRMGLQPLKRNVHMDEISQSMARDIALRNYFAHTTPEGLSPWDRYEAMRIPYYERAGEVSAKGQESAAEVVAGWMASPGHREIIAIPDLTHAGVGVYFDDSDYAQPVHVVMDMAEFPREDPATADWYQRGEVFNR